MRFKEYLYLDTLNLILIWHGFNKEEFSVDKISNTWIDLNNHLTIDTLLYECIRACLCVRVRTRVFDRDRFIFVFEIRIIGKDRNNNRPFFSFFF